MSPHGYHSHIDGLRAASVGFVLAFHFNLGPFTGGFVGVDVFFAISGYLIIGSIVTQQRAGQFRALAFWERRVRRLLPATTATLLLCLLAGGLLMTPSDLAQLARQSLLALASIINFSLVGEVGYFDRSAAPNPLLHFWSLAVEEQFYLLFPPLALLVHRYARPASYAIVICIVLVALSVVSFIAAEWLIRTGSKAFAYYLMPTRFGQLALGGVMAIALSAPSVRARFQVWPQWAHDLAVLLGLTLIVSAAVGYDDQTPFPGALALPPTVGALLILASGGRCSLRWLFENAVSSYVGKLSFSIYLVHWPLWAFLVYHLDRPPTLAETLAVLAGTMMLSAALYHLVETPIRFSPRARGKGLYHYVLPMICAALVTPVMVLYYDGIPARLSESTRAFVNNASEFHRRHFGGHRYSSGEPHILGQPDADIDFVLVGDSKARQFAAGLDEMLGKLNRSAVMITADGCPFFDDALKYHHGQPDPVCIETTRRALALVSEQRVRVVFARSWTNNRLRLRAPDGTALHFEPTTFARKHVEVARSYQVASGQAVVLVGNNDSFRNVTPVASCLTRPSWLGLPCLEGASLKAAHHQPTAVESSLREQVRREAGLSYLPTTDVFCPDGVCRQIAEDGTVLFSDPTHLSVWGARRLAPRLLALLGLNTPRAGATQALPAHAVGE